MSPDISDVSSVSDLSSVPSSPRSTPELESRYPTPSSSQDAEDLPSTRQDCPPAKKKRRRNPLPKERTTQHLSFSKSSEDQQDQVRLLFDTLRYQKDIVVIAGAGISTSAGIPDFRSEGGLFKSLQQKHNLKASGKLLFDAAVYQDDALTAPFHELVRSLSEEIKHCKPTKFHEMLASLGSNNRLKRLYTQNIDGLETSMQPLKSEIPLGGTKGRWPVTIQLHGSIEKMVCQKCRHLQDLEPSQFCEADPPDCEACCDNDTARQATGQRSHGIGRMRPRMVLYNEHNPDEEAITSVMNADVKSRPRVLVVAGTSLKIPGVRRLVKSLCTVIRSRKDGVTMFINNEPPPGKEFDDCFDLIVRGNTDQIADLAHLPPHTEVQDENWNFPEPVWPSAPGEESSASDSEREGKTSNISVVIGTPKKRPRSDTGLMTPSSSQDEQPNLPAAKAVKTAKGSTANPASRGPSINDLLGNAKIVPAKGRKKPATSTAPKKRGPKSAATAKTAPITNFTKVSKSKAASDATAGKKKPLGAAPGNGLPKQRAMFPGLGKKANVQNAAVVPEVVS
ncbi:NAD-dependent protein deacetylase hst4 [Penicillium manginii]|uniref:NAD-dependent protein deacetylase hst4 n=1 Tax=Penicillium manginii TaxID=203109 RepID=UPI0025486255|nr:NAD-dependent protein deacetylase hst4 [Penicillium manginii]KAJ5741734.1 NAD-dependent protein deacetylase hst4 [Penicillium manginii]